MNYASSIRYAGQLVLAANCDYRDYKYLGLLCPNCKNPVFLQGQSSRTLGEKNILIPPYFKHFSAKDPALVKQCEARVARYDQRELEGRAASARNQRLKLLQRSFWNLFINNAKCINSPGTFGSAEMERRIDTLLKDLAGIELPPEYSHLTPVLFPDLANIRLWVNQAVENKQHLIQHITNYLDAPRKDWVDIVARLNTKVDMRFHRLILQEIRDFLFAKSSRFLLEKCLLFSYVHSFFVSDWFWQQIEDKYPVGSVLLCDLAMHLIEIPWAEEFAQLQKQHAKATISVALH
jgi:hypothetical protein